MIREGRSCQWKGGRELEAVRRLYFFEPIYSHGSRVCPSTLNIQVPVSGDRLERSYDAPLVICGRATQI